MTPFEKITKNHRLGFIGLGHLGSWFYMGPSGSGAAAKLVVNTLLGTGMQAIAEAIALGKALGLPRDLLFDTLAKTAVVSPVQVLKLASAKRDDYTPQFPIRLMRKDFGLALSAATREGLWLPSAAGAAEVNAAEAALGAEEDFSAVVRWMEGRPRRSAPGRRLHESESPVAPVA